MGEMIELVYWGLTIGVDEAQLSSLGQHHKDALAAQIALNIQVLRQMQDVAPMFVPSDGASGPATLIGKRMLVLAMLVPGREEELLAEALRRLSTEGGAAIQALLFVSGMI